LELTVLFVSELPFCVEVKTRNQDNRQKWTVF
jgi:hypothetical protein